MLNKSYIYIYLSLMLIVFVVFWPMQDVFYQQDEWRALGSYFANDTFWSNFKNFTPLKLLLADGRVFSSVLGYFLIAKSPFNTTPLFFYTIALHFINSCLAFILAQKVLKSTLLAYLSAIFFIVSSVASGAVTWYGTSIGTLPATSLVLISLIFILEALDKNKPKYFIFSFIALYLSQYFKEIGYFLLLGYPILAFLYDRISLRSFASTFWYYFLTFGVIAISRYIQLSSYTAHTAVFTSQSSNNFFMTMFTRAFLYPFTSFSLIYIPPEYFLKIAKKFATIYYPFFPPPQFDLLVQSVVGDLIALSASFVILFLILIITRTKEQKKKVLFLILFILLTYLPYIILSKDYTYLDSRYYYLAAAPAGILISFIILRLKSLWPKIFFPSILLFVIYLCFNAYVTNSQTIKLADVSIERVSVLKQLSKLNSELQDQNVFFVTGDKNYYLRDGNNIPFQQGTGYTLLTWYGKNDNRFNEYLDTGLLWDLGSQGYFKKENVGFGFFWDKDQLLKSIAENNIPLADVKYLHYDSRTKVLSGKNPLEIK